MASSSRSKRKASRRELVKHKDTISNLSRPPAEGLAAYFAHRPMPSRLSKLWSDLSPYQRPAVTYATSRYETALIHSQGTGKTITTLAILAFWFETGQIENALVVCPLSVLPQWEEEHRKWCPWVPISFSTYQRFSPGVYSCVVADEMQYLKNRSSQTSKLFGLYYSNVPRKLGLTGTPMDEGPLELWAQFRFLCPWLFGVTWTKFKKEWTVPSGFRGKEAKLNPMLERQFWDKVRSVIHHLSLDVLTLPPFRVHKISYPLTRTQALIHRGFEKDLLIKIHGRTISPYGKATAMVYLFGVVSGYLPGGMRIASYKPAVFARLIKRIAPGKNIIFCNFRQEVNDVSAILTALGRSHGIMTGKNRKERENIKRGFKTGEFDDLVLGTKVGGVGLNLQEARNMIFYSRPYSRIVLDQAISRTRRRNQSQRLDMYYLEAKLSIDVHLSFALKHKHSFIKHFGDIVRGKGNFQAGRSGHRTQHGCSSGSHPSPWTRSEGRAGKQRR